MNDEIVTSSYLNDYAVLTDGNEAPRVFHQWAALSCLSHAVGRKVWADWGLIGKIFPHLYLVFVGDPGIKKSTAMNIAKHLILRLKDIPTTGESITREALTQLMGAEGSRCQKVYKHEDKPVRYAQMSIFANELVNLINSGGNPIGMIDFFTDVWDQEEYRVETKNKGSDVIIGPYISILGCLTPETVRMLMAQKVISGGMTRRCIFVMGDKAAKPVAFPEITPEQVAARERIMLHLHEVKKISGAFIWHHEARQVFSDWYETNFYRKQSETDTVLMRFLETKPELVIKVAMLIQLGQTPIKLEISSDSILAAIALLTACERVGSYLFAGTGRNELSPISVSISRLLETEQLPVNKKTIYKLFNKDATVQEIDQIIEQLVRTDQARTATVQQKGVNINYISTIEKMDAFVASLRAAGAKSG